MCLASEAETLVFLTRFKRTMVGDRLHVVNREKNNDTLRRFGYTLKTQEDIIFGLKPENYVKGPEQDRDMPGEFWFFGKKSKGQLLYIKLKLMEDGPITRSKCVSFHVAESPLSFPHKKSGAENE